MACVVEESPYVSLYGGKFRDSSTPHLFAPRKVLTQNDMELIILFIIEFIEKNVPFHYLVSGPLTTKQVIY